jgi:hypothetical protein
MQWLDLKQTENNKWEYELPDGRKAVSTFEAQYPKIYLRQQLQQRVNGAHAAQVIRAINSTDDPCVFTFTFSRTDKPDQATLDSLLRHGLKVTLPTIVEYDAFMEGEGRIEITADLWFKKLFTVVERTPDELYKEIVDLRMLLQTARNAFESAKRGSDQWEAAAESARQQLSSDEQRIEALVGALRQYAKGTPPIESTSKIGLLRSPEEIKRFHSEVDAMRGEGWKPTTVNHLYTDEGVRACVWLERELMPDGVIVGDARTSVLEMAELAVAGV